MTIATSASLTSIGSPAVDQGVYIAIHGHFYQPPRENPYLNAIERQEGAAPFHDWNQRIHHECYRPNAFARVMTHDGKLLKIVNNFEYLSFNIGATLLSWMEQYDRTTYQRIIEADRRSCDRLNGHGNAIAQVYNHIILPLANHRDKLTQIRWGKADFKARFGRETEGMWLAETAVDYPTLETLVDEGIKFIVLAPSQAKRCREIVQIQDSELPWVEVSGNQIDPTRPYRCYLSEDESPVDRRYIDIFFYDGPISRDMGFGDLLSSSESFAARLGQAVRGDHRASQLISVATDGETFGHHKHFTEKALAYAFTDEFPRRGWIVTNYAHYLSLHPPTWEVQLKSVTAWSCAHGVGRWESDCGCGGEGGVWHQKWRAPLRDSLNWLRDRLTSIFAEVGLRYFPDPWAARDAYIHVLRDSLRHGTINNQEQLESFFQQYGRAVTHNNGVDRVDALRLLEMQRHALLMFTSCGWFFEEISRPEGVQILRYAGRAIELAADVTGVLLEAEFIHRLTLCPSNVPEFANGAEVYRQLVLTSRITLKQVAAHYAISSLFTTYLRSQQLYCYTIDQHDYQLQRMGSMALAIGQIRLSSGITQESVDLVFAVLHLGGYDFHCSIQQFSGRKAYEEIKANLFTALHQASAATVILGMAEAFDQDYFSLQHLFAEERHRILHLLARETLTRLDQLYAQVYRDNYGILASFRRDGLPVPPELQVAAEITLNQRLLSELKRLETGDLLPISELDAVAQEADHLGCNLNRTEAAKILEKFILQQFWQMAHGESAGEFTAQSFEQLNLALGLAQRLHLSLNLDRAQEFYLNYVSVQTALLGENHSNHHPDGLANNLTKALSESELQQLWQLGERISIAVTI